MSAARFPAWSSPNFFTTANGNAAQLRRCCIESSRARSRFTMIGLPAWLPRSPFVGSAVDWPRALLRPEQPRPTEDDVAQRPPGAVRVLLEQAEAAHPELGIVGRHGVEGAVERLRRQVVRHRDVRVVRETQLARQRPAPHLGLQPLTLA